MDGYSRESNIRCRGCINRWGSVIVGGTLQWKLRSLDTADWSTFRNSFDVIQRPFGVGWLNWNRKRSCRQSVSEKKGRKEVVDGVESSAGGELQESVERSHSRRSNARRGEMDQALSATDFTSPESLGNSGR